MTTCTCPNCSSPTAEKSTRTVTDVRCGACGFSGNVTIVAADVIANA